MYLDIIWDLSFISLPASLSLLPNLKVLLLEGNPLRGIRRDLLTVGDTKTQSKYSRPDNAVPVIVHCNALLNTVLLYCSLLFCALHCNFY